MLHVCVKRFDVTGNLKNFAKVFGTKQPLNTSVKLVASQLIQTVFSKSGCKIFWARNLQWFWGPNPDFQTNPLKFTKKSEEEVVIYEHTKCQGQTQFYL
jgi:phosphorylcholine metabolism protein LicD